MGYIQGYSEMIKLLEFYPERQGRPDSEIALDMGSRHPSIPPGGIRAAMIKDFGKLVAYLASIEVMSDDMLELLLHEDYGLEARFELLDSWATDLRDLTGTKATAAASGAVTTSDSFMAYIKQLVTELIVVDGIVDDILTDTGTTIPGTITTLQGNVTTILSRITAAVALASSLATHDTDIKALLTTIAGYIDAEVAAIITLIGSPADGDVSTDIVNVQTVVDALDTLTKAAGDGDLAAMKIAIDAIVAAGPTKVQMDAAHALLATPAQVATALNAYDAVKRSEATSDKNEIIGMAIAMGG